MNILGINPPRPFSSRFEEKEPTFSSNHEENRPPPPHSSARAAVVAEAIAWLGTPYHHGARLKGVGVDCAQLVLGVYVGAGLIEAFDTGDYPPDWHLHRDNERYLTVVQSLATEIDPADVQPGDVLLFRFGRAFSHGAIVTAWPQVVHANRKDGAVVLGDALRDADLAGRPMKAFSYFR